MLDRDFGESLTELAIPEMQSLRSWSPDDWQTYINALLRLRYGADYVPCPDKHGGDEGIEGFVRKQGLAFQCYAPQDTYRPKELYEKHRDKITKDLPKLIEHKDEFIKLFGTTKLKQWVLLVPQHDSVETLKHGEAKAALIREANLPFIEADFCVSVDTDDFFPLEKKQLRSEALIPVSVELRTVVHAVASEWADNNDVLVQRLDSKLRKLRPGADESDVRKAREDRIRHYIAANNFLDNLRRDYEEFWEKSDSVQGDQ